MHRKPGGVFDHHHGLARLAARTQIQLGIVGGKAVDLVYPLLQIAQVQQVARAGRKGTSDPLGTFSPSGGIDTFNLAFDHLHLKYTTAQILGWQVNTGGDVTTVDVAFG